MILLFVVLLLLALLGALLSVVGLVLVRLSAGEAGNRRLVGWGLTGGGCAVMVLAFTLLLALVLLFSL